jgi:hypothetical protein
MESILAQKSLMVLALRIEGLALAKFMMYTSNLIQSDTQY